MSKELKFSADWFSKNLHEFIYYVKYEFNGKSNIRALEVGSFEGLSTKWFLDNICNGNGSTIHCIDTWKGSPEHEEWTDEQSLYDRFINNLSEEIEEGRCLPMRGRSEDLLISLLKRDEKFDFIYIDGSHESSDVITDAVISYMLLKQNGMMIFDDYTWGLGDRSAYDIPHYAIDFFRNSFLNSKKMETISLGQMAILKKA